jgi:hypothetical protein
MVNFANLKKFFLYTLIGSLIATASVTVIIVLFGTFNETTSRVFLTLLMVIVHSLVSLLFIYDDERQNTFERLAFFTNVLFILIILSFITSIFSIWEIVGGETAWKMYQIYFLTAFASLHCDILSKIFNKEKYMDYIIYANYLFIGVVYLMLIPLIIFDNDTKLFGEFYYRVLAANGIIDGTLSILSIIFYKLFVHKHPETDNPVLGGVSSESGQKKNMSIWVWILIIYLTMQVVTPMILYFVTKF